ncbi:hypothetical protein EMPS_04863 [Entomortierella parvispora]|uniref:Beta-lactamase-related domain-containing protein n=1 Tax=Entomortierella parvispora TaxID=205924 RepID=A0A9P3LW72_9FUNG|nr:hypothetical protein EMPS_04863 [Entomortierella parvispora]
MKILTVTPLLLLGAALASIEGAPLNTRLSSSNVHQNWRDAIELARNQTGTPGLSVAVLHKGEIIFAEGFGNRNNKGEPVTPETLMPIGSMTKAMTAAMIGELVAEGKLDWDKTPVVEYVPTAKFSPVLTSELTLSDYLSHRTGLPHDQTPWTKSTETNAEVYSHLKYLNLPDKLRTNMQYSNIGYAIAGSAAENVAKVPYKDLVRNKIFGPLGMTNSGFSPIEMSKRPNHSRPHYADSLKDAQDGKFHEGEFDNFFEVVAAAGEVYSNVYDILKWGSTIMNYGKLDGKQVLDKDAVEEQLAAHTIARDRRVRKEFGLVANYGFGWGIDSYKGQAMFEHSGAVLGFSSDLALFPDSELVIVTLTNIFGSTLPNLIGFYLVDEILDLPRTEDWLGKVALEQTKKTYDEMAESNSGANLPPRLSNSPTVHPLEEYEGVYSSPLFSGDVTISLKSEIDEDGSEKSGLHFLFNTFTSKVEHYHFETFTFKWDFWSGKDMQLMTFITGGDGKVDAFQIKYVQDQDVVFKKQARVKTGKSEQRAFGWA